MHFKHKLIFLEVWKMTRSGPPPKCGIFHTFFLTGSLSEMWNPNHESCVCMEDPWGLLLSCYLVADPRWFVGGQIWTWWWWPSSSPSQPALTSQLFIQESGGNGVELETYLREVWKCIITKKAPTMTGPSPGWKQLLMLSHLWIH